MPLPAARDPQQYTTKPQYKQSVQQGMQRYLFLFALLALCVSATPTFAQLGDEESEYDLRVKAILDEIGFEYEITDLGDFKVLMSLEEERTQVVYVKSATEFYDEMEVREIWSVGYVVEGDIPGEVANKLLENSFDQKIGAWQVIRDDETSLAIFAVKMSANANAASVRSAIIAAVRSADAMEMELTGDTDAF